MNEIIVSNNSLYIEKSDVKHELKGQELIDFTCGAIRHKDKLAIKDLKIILEHIRKTIQSFTDEELITGYFSLVENITFIDNVDRVYQCARLLFCISKEMIVRRRDIAIFRALIEFCKNDLFILYIENKNHYYRIAYAFYQDFLGKNPNLSINLYENVENILFNRPDNGYMNIDYLYITYFLASCGKDYFSQTMSTDELNTCDLIINSYRSFCEFANRQYGYKRYNLPKANKLMKTGMQKVAVNTNDPGDRHVDCYFWAALSYASSEATAQYSSRVNIMNCLQLGDYIPAPTDREQQIMESFKKSRTRKIVLRILLVLAVIYVVVFVKPDLGLLCLLALIGAPIFIYALDGGNPNLWFIGYHYSGPPYWHH